MKFYRMSQIVALVSLAVIGASGCNDAQSQASMSHPQPQVEVVTVKAQDVLFQQTLPARSVAFREAEIRPQVTGIITKRLFEEGALVEAGQALYQIDDAIYQANLLAAEADVAITKSNIKQVFAELNRYKVLVKDNVVSQQDLERIEAQYAAYQAELGKHQADLYKTKVDISYTKVLAPISGRISKSNITEGALVTAQQAQALAKITQLDPIYFDLPMANSELRKTRQRLTSGELTKVESIAELEFSDGEMYTHKGLLKFNEVQANPSTDTVSIRVQFDNPEYALLPGMYARVKLNQAKREDSILVPQKAVQYDLQGKAFVLVVDQQQQVQQRNVSIDRAIELAWLVTDGLKVGERVMVTGLQKVAPGMAVEAIELVSEQVVNNG